MKRYDELTRKQQEQAVNKAASDLLKAILQGAIQFSDRENGGDLQARIDAACEKANEMQTPWFAHEYIMETCGEEVLGMARADAEDAMYSEQPERVIPLHALA